HGDFVEPEGLAICPSDTVGSNLAHAVTFEDLRRILEKRGAVDNLTAVFDCCHTVASKPSHRRARSLTGRQLPQKFADKPIDIGARVLAANRRGGVAFQADFAGRSHGAFTWALTSLLEQWRAVQEGSAVRLTVSYGEARKRAERLLDALSFDQTPELRGVAHVDDLPFFHPGNVV